MFILVKMPTNINWWLLQLKVAWTSMLQIYQILSQMLVREK